MTNTGASSTNETRELLRHTVATLAYRARKAVTGVPPSFASFRSGETARTPLEILSHLGDLFDWALHLVRGEYVWNQATPLQWDEEVSRFFKVLDEFDACLASNQALGFPAERIFQGPIADALTHVGQIGILRRMAGSPMQGENYFKAEIAAGRILDTPTAPRTELD